MKLVLGLTIDCDNDAFDPHWQDEAARILHSAASLIDARVFGESGTTFPHKVLHDTNGNMVGTMTIDYEVRSTK